MDRVDLNHNLDKFYFGKLKIFTLLRDVIISFVLAASLLILIILAGNPLKFEDKILSRMYAVQLIISSPAIASLCILFVYMAGILIRSIYFRGFGIRLLNGYASVYTNIFKKVRFEKLTNIKLVQKDGVENIIFEDKQGQSIGINTKYFENSPSDLLEQLEKSKMRQV